MKIGILHHGGPTRKMITVEVGRASKRDIKFDTAEAALDHVRVWLDLPSPTTQPHGNNAAVIAALKDMIAKFRACAIRFGSDPEFVDAALEDARAALASIDSQ